MGRRAKCVAVSSLLVDITTLTRVAFLQIRILEPEPMVLLLLKFNWFRWSSRVAALHGWHWERTDRQFHAGLRARLWKQGLACNRPDHLLHLLNLRLQPQITLTFQRFRPSQRREVKLIRAKCWFGLLLDCLKLPVGQQPVSKLLRHHEVCHSSLFGRSGALHRTVVAYTAFNLMILTMAVKPRFGHRCGGQLRSRAYV